MLAGSGTYADNRKFLPARWEGVDIVLGVARRERQMSPIGRLVAHILQNIAVLPRLREYDAVLSTGTSNGVMLAFWQTLACRTRPAHVIIDNALPSVFPPRRRHLLLVPRVVFSSVAGVACFAKRQAEYWNQALKLKDRARFVPLGFDWSEFDVEPAEQSGSYIFSAGRSARDWETLLRAVRGIRAKTIVVAGKDALTGKLGIEEQREDQVQLLVEVPYAQYLSLLRAARVVVIALRPVPYVSGQSVLLHAMALGKAIVATRGMSTEDYVLDGETGLLVEPGDSVELGAKIAWLLANPAEAKRLGQAAREAARRDFNQESMSQRIGEIVSGVVGRSSLARP